MACFFFTSHCFISRTATGAVVMISLLAPVLRGQVGHPAGSAALGGVVLDSQNRPAQGAGISLQGKTNSQVRKVVTDAGGAYRFSGLDRGTYTLRAEMKGTGEAQ